MFKRLATSRWLIGLALVLGLLGGFFFLSATATASMRFWECGPSTLDHADLYCRVASRLLYQSCLAGGIAILLLCVGLYLKRLHMHAA